jgi:integrase
MATGTITYVKSSQRWLYQIDFGRLPNGKRDRKSKSFKNEADARQALALELAKINKTTYIVAESAEKLSSGIYWQGSLVTSQTQLKDFFEYFLSLCTAKPHTIEGYFETARQIARRIGEVPLKDLTPELLTQFFNDFKKCYAQATINKTFGFLKRVLEYAKERELISKNPMDILRRPKTTKEGEANKQEYKAFKDDELRQVLKACKDYHISIYTVVKLLQYSGLRPGEARGLRWEDVDFKEGLIHVRQAATQEREGMTLESRGTIRTVIGTTKTPYSIRKIPVNDEVLTILKEWQEYVKSDKGYEKARKCEYVFPSTRGGMLGKTGFSIKFRKAMQQAGLHGRGYELYTFRHTFCTNLIKQGVDIPTVQRLMGDNTTDVILKIYTSVEERDLVSATERLRGYFEKQAL